MKRAIPQCARGRLLCKKARHLRAPFSGALLGDFVRSAISWTLCIVLCASGISKAQRAATPAGAQKYKLTIDENASRRKRIRNGRVSSQAVVKVKDENDVPVPAIVVTFSIRGGGGATFANGGLTSIVTTNEEGRASSGPYSAPEGSSFTIIASAATPAGVIPVTIPVSGVSGGGNGLSTMLWTEIIAGAAAGAGIALYFGLRGSSQPPSGTIGAQGSPSFGPPAP